VSVLRLALDVSDPLHRSTVEHMFDDAFTLRRALQRGARDACRAYGRATHERAADPKAARERLGLTRTALEHRAYAHLNDAPHLRRGLTKALAMHVADEVWSTVDRHLFRDSAGGRSGAPRIGRWFDFVRIPGRARSHTTEHKWETFRLHGSLAGHRAFYTASDGDFVQPRTLRPVSSKAWWTYEGPLAVVFTGLGGHETLVLPVRLPTAPSNQAMLEHHLADPSRWHKIDLVRHRSPSTPGGWRYEAHLMVLTAPYVSPSATERRAQVALEAADRTAGIDINVSNVTIASHDTTQQMRISRIERDEPQQQKDRRRAKRDRRRQRELERSRRAANRAQYQLSKRQEKHARRRAEAGQRPVDVIPMGPRVARADGVPLQSFRRDTLSSSFRRGRATQAAEAESAARARRDRARAVAATVVATHGYQLVVEDTSITAWASSWGRALAAFAPGMLVDAIDREARAVATLAGGRGGVERAATRPTALSQHCPCGERVSKSLRDRIHVCEACGLRSDRDAVSAVLASFVVLLEKEQPASARVDYDAARAALPEIRRALRSSSYLGWQDTLSESTDLSARDGSFVAWTTSTLVSRQVARRNVGTASCATLNETDSRRTTSERACVRTDRSTSYVPQRAYLRDNS
jgi:hypothetical protein